MTNDEITAFAKAVKLHVREAVTESEARFEKRIAELEEVVRALCETESRRAR